MKSTARRCCAWLIGLLERRNKGGFGNLKGQEPQRILDSTQCVGDGPKLLL